jgi:hypothetical protein
MSVADLCIRLYVYIFMFKSIHIDYYYSTICMLCYTIERCMTDDKRCTNPTRSCAPVAAIAAAIAMAVLQDTIFFHQTGVPRSRPFCSISFNKGDRLVSLQLSSHPNTCTCTCTYACIYATSLVTPYGLVSSRASYHQTTYHISYLYPIKLKSMGFFFLVSGLGLGM